METMRNPFFLAAALPCAFAAFLALPGAASAQGWQEAGGPGLKLAQEVACIATTVFHESRGEPAAGMVAVGQVAMNRAHGSGSTACAVVYSRSGGHCQFAWACGARPVAQGSDWDRARTVAEALLSPAGLPDPTGGALFFNVCRHPPGSGLVLAARIGAHCFFRQAGSQAGHPRGAGFLLEEDSRGAHGWRLAYSARDSFPEVAEAPAARHHAR